MIYYTHTREVVEEVLRQLTGFVPKGESVEFHLCLDVADHITFKAVQIFGEQETSSTEKYFSINDK